MQERPDGRNHQNLDQRVAQPFTDLREAAFRGKAHVEQEQKLEQTKEHRCR